MDFNEAFAQAKVEQDAAKFIESAQIGLSIAQEVALRETKEYGFDTKIRLSDLHPALPHLIAAARLQLAVQGTGVEQPAEVAAFVMDGIVYAAFEMGRRSVLEKKDIE